MGYEKLILKDTKNPIFCKQQQQQKRKILELKKKKGHSLRTHTGRREMRLEDIKDERL